MHTFYYIFIKCIRIVPIFISYLLSCFYCRWFNIILNIYFFINLVFYFIHFAYELQCYRLLIVYILHFNKITFPNLISLNK